MAESEQDVDISLSPLGLSGGPLRLLCGLEGAQFVSPIVFGPCLLGVDHRYVALPVLRLSRTQLTAAFGWRDTLTPGYVRAVEAARSHRTRPQRQGSRNPTFHCPGRAGSREVLLGRLQRDFWRNNEARRYGPGTYWGILNAAVVVTVPEQIRDVLEDVCSHLGLTWDPATVGAVPDRAPDVTADELEAELLRANEAHFAIESAVWPERAVDATRRWFLTQVVATALVPSGLDNGPGGKSLGLPST